MCLRMVESLRFDIDMGSYSVGDIQESINAMQLDWPDWYPPTPMDDLQEAQGLQANLQSGVISRETGTRSVAVKYGITDIQKESKKAKKDLTENDKNDKSQSGKSKISKNTQE